MYTVIKHPLITHKLTQMRKAETGTKDFRQNLDEVAGLMAYEITRDLPLKPVKIQTPLASCDTYELEKPIILVPILRAGLGMVNGICNLIPTAKVAHTDCIVMKKRSNRIRISRSIRKILMLRP